ncbi:MAG: 4-hydroxy-tetrahydrodipicolinate reductase [Candidatus Hydrogenedentes bacterium]|nr:4-hydroxy-tetrahydrodipicolinate reductase [Candidatus Hydrogenedentota bacterium]
MKICMAGACGRMGRRVLELAVAEPDIEIGGAFDVPTLAGTELIVGTECNCPRHVQVGTNAAAEIAQSDVLIDFTVAQACVGNALLAAKAGKPCVIGTTGLSVEYKAELIAMAREVAIVYAPNMSVGVNLLFKIANEVALVLGLDYNVEITEIHHNLKKDSPSGTAVRLAEGIADVLGLDYRQDVAHGREGMVGERPVRQIGMHALRGGDVIGEHTVSFIGRGERVELTHKAHSRDNFARGALRAVRFAIAAAPGLYDMQDVLGLK